MKRSLSQGERWLYALSGVLMLGLGGFAGLASYLGAEPQWANPTPRSVPTPNGYDLYVAAGTAIIANKPQRHVSQLFERAKSADSLQPDHLRSQTYLPSKTAQALEGLARYNFMAANTAKMGGDWPQAAQKGLDIIEMGGDIGRGAVWSRGSRLSLNIESQGVETFDGIISKLNGKEASEATKRLEQLISNRESAVEMMREEKWAHLLEIQNFLKRPSWRKDALSVGRPWAGISTKTPVPKQTGPLRKAVNRLFLSKRRLVASYTRTADWSIDQMQQPYSPMPTPPEADNVIDGILKTHLISDYFAMRFRTAQAETKLSQLLLRLALQAHHAEKGEYPAKLSSLTPAYIKKIPLDPFGPGTPLRYQKKGPSYVLWSIGPDGKNDGGQPIPPLVLDKRTQKIIAIYPEGLGDVIATPELGGI